MNGEFLRPFLGEKAKRSVTVWSQSSKTETKNLNCDSSEVFLIFYYFVPQGLECDPAKLLGEKTQRSGYEVHSELEIKPEEIPRAKLEDFAKDVILGGNTIFYFGFV